MSFFVNFSDEIERRELEIERLKEQLKRLQKQLKAMKQLRVEIEARKEEKENEQV